MGEHMDCIPSTTYQSLLHKAREQRVERDAALAEVTRLREALTAARAALEGQRVPQDIPAAFLAIDAALAEGSDVPGVVPACAGRSNAAHERTQMTPAPSGWRCPVCSEVDDAD